MCQTALLTPNLTTGVVFENQFFLNIIKFGWIFRTHIRLKSDKYVSFIECFRKINCRKVYIRTAVNVICNILLSCKVPKWLVYTYTTDIFLKSNCWGEVRRKGPCNFINEIIFVDFRNYRDDIWTCVYRPNHLSSSEKPT